MSRNGDTKVVAVDPLTTDQRRRLECMTAVYQLWETRGYQQAGKSLPDHSIIRLTEYLYGGYTAPQTPSQKMPT